MENQCFVDYRRYKGGRYSTRRTRAYRSWDRMIQRCTNPNYDGYARYGALGITVCSRWRLSFDDFFEDMGHCPEGHSLDRIKGDQGYSPDNCRWATRREQALNRCVTRWIEHDGERLCLSDWAQRLGMSSQTLRARLEAGWTMDEAIRLGNRTGQRTSLLEHDGETLSLSDWARRIGISATTLSYRLKIGWTLSEIIPVGKGRMPDSRTLR